MPPGFEQAGVSSGAFDGSLLELAIYAAAILMLIIVVLVQLAVFSLPVFFAAMGLLEWALRLANNLPDPFGKLSKIAGLVFRSLRRNLLRTALTYVALFVLTGMLTFIYSIVHFLGEITREKESNVQVILTEKFQFPSQMPPGYVQQLKAVLETKLPPENRPRSMKDDIMVWGFVGGTLDPNNRSNENSLFLIAMEPHTILTMMDSQGLTKEDLSEDGYKELERAVALMQEDKRNVIIGQERLKLMGKQVGDEIKLHGLNYQGVEFQMRIVASFPAESRFGMSAVMHLEYLYSMLDDYKAKTGKPHPVADRCIALVWVRLPDKPSYERLAAAVSEPGAFSAPAVKLETASAGFASFLEPFKDIFWAMKWVMMPAVVAIMCLVVGITITIGVRERWTEMAVMKVLGFQPWQIMGMISLEAVLVGIFGGMLSTWTVYFAPIIIRTVTKFIGVKVAFFDQFKSPWEIVIYGPILGILVGLIGSAVPAWSARKVKVSEVFAKVA